jgi:hypothetical protein
MNMQKGIDTSLPVMAFLASMRTTCSTNSGLTPEVVTMAETEMPKNASSLVSHIYGRWTLDSVIEVARCVSLDFVSRPRHYRGISEGTASALENFKALVGNHPQWPDQAQRTAIYGGGTQMVD